MFFFLKRCIFVILLIAAKDYIWVQVAALNFMALGSLMYTLWLMPFDSMKANLFEVFNDSTLLVLTYHLWCFTDMIQEAETRNELGFIFIAVSLSNIALHLVALIIENIKTCIASVRRRQHERLLKEQ